MADGSVSAFQARPTVWAAVQSICGSLPKSMGRNVLRPMLGFCWIACAMVPAQSLLGCALEVAPWSGWTDATGLASAGIPPGGIAAGGLATVGPNDDGVVSCGPA